jgi:ABC-2 type transport system ATP-binding protein
MTYGVQDLSVVVGGTAVLHGVTVAADPGAITAVVGGDGAGKSTLLRVIVGRVAPTTGSVRAPPPERIGYQPSRGGSWPDLTATQNMQFVGGAYGLSGAELARRTDDLLRRAGLFDARDRLSRDLSGGMRTKLGFCLAMIHQPDLLVLDEPSTGVDPVSRVDLWRLLSEAAAAGTAVLLSTSYLDEAQRAASVIVLDRGRVLLSGSPQDVIDSSPGVVALTNTATRPQFAWRDADGFREWFPDHAPVGQPVADVNLEDVVIVATLRAINGLSP